MTRAQLAKILIEGPEERESPKAFLSRHPGIGKNKEGDEEGKKEELPAPPKDKPAENTKEFKAAADGDTKEKPPIDKKIGVFLNRLLLRIFSVPALLTYLADVALVQDDEDQEGNCKIQLDFLRLPDEIHPQLIKLCASPRPPKMVRYVKNGSARVGLEMDVKPDDFGGEEYDLAV